MVRGDCNRSPLACQLRLDFCLVCAHVCARPDRRMFSCIQNVYTFSIIPTKSRSNRQQNRIARDSTSIESRVSTYLNTILVRIVPRNAYGSVVASRITMRFARIRTRASASSQQSTVGRRQQRSRSTILIHCNLALCVFN